MSIFSTPFKHAFKHKGGSAPKPPAAVPPVSRSATDVSDAERQQKLAQANKQGMKSTLLAGSQTPQSGGMGSKSLLG